MTLDASGERRMPVLFAGHGSPMNAVEDNEFTGEWAEMARLLPRPRAILCVSAHWETRGTRITAQDRPKTIHDFYGFPPELYGVQYPAPGSPDIAAMVRDTVPSTPIALDHDWGLDHGTWSVLVRMFPRADIPVLQLSLDRAQPPESHYALGRALRPLRDQDILIMGSGNLVHNLRLVDFQDIAYGWAVEFDETVKELILSGDHGPLIDYRSLGEAARLAVPTTEHYLPLLYALALQDPQEPVRFFAARVTLGSISMRSVLIG